MARNTIDLKFRFLPFVHWSVYWWALKCFVTKGRYVEPRKTKIVKWNKSRTEIWVYWIKFYA